MNLNSLATDRIRIYGDHSEKICIILVGAHADEIPQIISEGDKGFFSIAVTIDDWNAELSPWKAAPVFGDEPFGDGASGLLDAVETGLIPFISEKYGPKKFILMGYSLAGLFALYGIYKSRCFCGAIAVSPSVWFPGWKEFIEDRVPNADFVCLSLGDREEKTKNRTMACVGDNIRYMNKLLTEQGIETCLEWNPGGHFRDVPQRMKKGIVAGLKLLNSR